MATSGWPHSLIAIVHIATLAAAVFLAGYYWRGRQARRTLERLLFPELVAMRWQAASLAVEIERRHRVAEPFDSTFFALWRLSPPLVYPAGGAALARLSGGALDRIGYFHAQLADARARLAEAREAGGFEPSPYRMLSGLVRAVNHVQPWCSAMELRLGHIGEELPDMAGANALLGEFERTGDEPLAIAYAWVDCARWQGPEAP